MGRHMVRLPVEADRRTPQSLATIVARQPVSMPVVLRSAYAEADNHHRYRTQGRVPQYVVVRLAESLRSPREEDEASSVVVGVLLVVMVVPRRQ